MLPLFLIQIIIVLKEKSELTISGQRFTKIWEQNSSHLIKKYYFLTITKILINSIQKYFINTRALLNVSSES